MAHIARIIRPCRRTWKATRSDGVEGKMKRSTWIARTERLGGKSTSECACEIVFGEPSNYHTYCANRNWQDAWDVKEHWHVIFANRLFIQPANNGGADAVLGAPRPRVCQYICVYSVSLCPWANIHSIHIPGHFQPYTRSPHKAGWTSMDWDPNSKSKTATTTFFTWIPSDPISAPGNECRRIYYLMQLL